jgi:hypothetical protein
MRTFSFPNANVPLIFLLGLSLVGLPGVPVMMAEAENGSGNDIFGGIVD